MAKRSKKYALTTAEKYAAFLLYEATGGSMGVKADGKAKDMTFGEKRGLLDSLIKIAVLERESEGDEEQPSGLDAIRKEIAKRKKQDAGGKTWGAGISGGSESGGNEFADDSTSEPPGDDETDHTEG